MEFEYSPYVLPLIAAAVISGWVALYAWSKRQTSRSALALCLLSLAITEWAVGYTLEIAGADLATKLWWGKSQYLGIVIIPVFWLVFALSHTYQSRQMPRRTLSLLTIMPIITLIMALTTEKHHLLWREFSLYKAGEFSALDISYGPWFWVHSAYSYTLLLFGTILIIRSLRRMRGLYRGQAVALLIGVLAPWLGNALYLSGLSPLPHLDLTPFAFTLTTVALAWGIFGVQLMDMAPLARDMVVDDMQDAMLVLDTEGRIADLNPAAERLIGQDITQVQGTQAKESLKKWPEMIDKYRNVTEALDEIAIGEGEAQTWYEIRITALKDWRRRPVGRVVLIRNITDRKRTEERLNRLTREQRIILDNIPVGVAIQKADQAVWVNRATVTISGYTLEALQALPTFMNHADPEFFQRFQENITERLAQGESVTAELRFKRKDGSLIWCDTIAQAINPDNVQGDGIIWVIQDITARRQMDEQLRQLSRAVEASPASIVITNTDGDIEYVNPKFTEVTGYTAQEALGQNPSILKTEQTIPETHEQLWDTITAGKEWRGEFCNRKKNGEIYWEFASISPITDARGNITHYIAVKEDISERKHAEAELRRYTEELEASNAELDAFAHTVAHDLKNPLTVLIGFSMLMEKHIENMSPERLVETLQLMTRTGKKMTSIINELLLLANVRKKGDVDTGPLDMAAIVTEVLDRLEGMVMEYQADIILPDTWPTATGYAAWVEEVWVNYVSNALKYGGRPDEGLAPRVELSWEEGPEPNTLRFYVCDNGPGLTEEESGQLFTQFTRLHKANTEGHGLGLSIVQRIVKKLGGTVGVTSHRGQGSCFYFTLPVLQDNRQN